MSSNREPAAALTNIFAADGCYSPSHGPIVIGIGGATNAGKTSLACHLVKIYPWSDKLGLDDYFWPEDHANHSWVSLQGESKTRRRHQNWDCPLAFDWNSLRHAIQAKSVELRAKTAPNACRQRLPVLIVEGILIYAESTIANLINEQIFITLPFDVCLQRRLQRHYEPPDPDGYFEQVVWPEYEKHLKWLQLNQPRGQAENEKTIFLNGNDAAGGCNNQPTITTAKCNPHILFLDGTKPQAELFKIVENFLDPLLISEPGL